MRFNLQKTNFRAVTAFVLCLLFTVCTNKQMQQINKRLSWNWHKYPLPKEGEAEGFENGTTNI